MVILTFRSKEKFLNFGLVEVTWLNDMSLVILKTSFAKVVSASNIIVTNQVKLVEFVDNYTAAVVNLKYGLFKLSRPRSIWKLIVLLGV